MITHWLIRRRDTAADHWVTDTTNRAAQRRLQLWDALLGLWTHNGTRHLTPEG